MNEPPFWSFCWSSGQVLARWIMERKELVEGRRVLAFETDRKEQSMKGVTISERCLEVYPWMKFGYCLVKDPSAVQPLGG